MSILLVVLAVELAAAQVARFTLEEALARARAANLSLRASGTIVGEARAELVRSRFWVPQSPFFTGGYLQSPQTGFGPNYGITLSQEFEVAGQRGRRISAAEALVERARWEQRAAEVNLAAAVTMAFNGALAAAERVVLAQRGKDAVEDIVARAAEMDDASPGVARIDRNQIKVQLARARREVAAAQRAAATDLDSLRQLLDLPSEQAVELIGVLPRQRQPLLPLQELVARALVQRPDLMAARLEVERTARQIAVVRREAVPNVTLSGTLSRFDDETFAGGDIGLNLPILRDNEPELLEAIVARDRADLQANDLERTIEREVRLAFRGCEGAGEDLEFFRDQIVPPARENLEIQRPRFEEGEVGALEFIGAIVEMQLAEREALDAAQIYADALAELERVVAGAL